MTLFCKFPKLTNTSSQSGIFLKGKFQTIIKIFLYFQVIFKKLFSAIRRFADTVFGETQEWGEGAPTL